MIISALTDIGNHRESNQDTYDCGIFETGDSWVVVCDGMGGVSGGQIASELCVEKVSSAIKRGYRENLSVKAAQNLLLSAIAASNSIVHNKAQEEPQYHGMGTTIVAAIIIKNIVVIAHVGDSRAYILSDKTVKQITKDHSLVQLMIDNGKITADEAKNHPDKNIITRAVGVVNFVDVEFDVCDVNSGEKLLVCTDGLSGSVSDEEMINIINEYSDSSAEKLVEKALENGSRDNITVVVMSAQGE